MRRVLLWCLSYLGSIAIADSFWDSGSVSANSLAICEIFRCSLFFWFRNKEAFFIYFLFLCWLSVENIYIYILLASANSSHWNYLSFRGICTHHVTLQNMSSTHVTFLRGKGREINASTAIVSLSKLDTYTVEAVRQREKSFTAEAFHKLVTVLLDARCCGTEKFRQQDGTAAIAWNRASGWQFVRYWYCRVFKFTPR